MVLSVPQLRQAWRKFECEPNRLVRIPFGPDFIRVAPPSVEAWQALWAVLEAHGYNLRTNDTDSYSCRQSTSGGGRSLHSFGIALDINWDTNPWIDHAGNRPARFSSKASQAERAQDVAAGTADTDMTPAMIADVMAIKSKSGERVFVWGGNWNTVKDCMHFEIDVAPEDLASGIDWATVRSNSGGQAPAATDSPTGSTAGMYRVIARNGLHLRLGPGVNFGIARTLPFGATVHVLRWDGDWGLSDIQGDGAADGHVLKSFLEAA